MVQETRPWEKAPTYRKGQARHGHPSPEPEAEALPEQTEAPVAAVPAPPKQQRNPMPKKESLASNERAGVGECRPVTVACVDTPHHAQALDSDLVDGYDCGCSFNIPLSILTRKVNGDILFGLIFKPLLVMTR